MKRRSFSTRPLSAAAKKRLLHPAVQPDGGLYKLGWYLGWTPGQNLAVLDGQFTADQLEAIATHMRTTNQPAKR